MKFVIAGEGIVQPLAKALDHCPAASTNFVACAEGANTKTRAAKADRIKIFGFAKAKQKYPKAVCVFVLSNTKIKLRKGEI